MTIRVFERWLKAQGITPAVPEVPTRKFEYRGRWEGFGTSGSNDWLLLNHAKRLYKFFGYLTVADFLTAVASRAALAHRRS